MAFSTKTDYSGLSTIFSTALAVRDDNENASQSTYEPDGQDGAILDVEVYGENAAPSNTFALKAAINATAGQIELGKVVTVGQKKYRLKSLKLSSKVNGPKGISTSSELVESGAVDNTANNFPLPAFAIDTAHLAQIFFSAFTVSGEGANLVSCDAEASVSLSKDTLVGAVISNGAGKAMITVSGSILVKGDTAPTVSPSQGWKLTKAPTCQNPETAYKTYTFELKKPIARGTAPAAQQ